MSVDAQRGQRLRSERERLGWSQQQVAAALDIRREMWAKYEAGAEPGASVLGRAALAGIDVLFVLTGERNQWTRGTALRDGESTLLDGFRSLDSRSKAAVLALIGGMSGPEASPQKRTKIVQKAEAPGTMQFGVVENFNPAKDRKK